VLDLIVLGLFLPLAVAAITVMSNYTWAHVVGMFVLYLTVDAVGIGFLTTRADVPIIASLVLFGAWIVLGARCGWKRKPAFLVLAIVFWGVVAGGAFLIVGSFGNPVVWYELDVLTLAHTGVTPIAAALSGGAVAGVNAAQTIAWYACAPALVLSVVAFVAGRFVPVKATADSTAGTVDALVTDMEPHNVG